MGESETPKPKSPIISDEDTGQVPVSPVEAFLEKLNRADADSPPPDDWDNQATAEPLSKEVASDAAVVALKQSKNKGATPVLPKKS